MGFIIKDTAALINTKITDTGRQQLSQGNFNIAYFQSYVNLFIKNGNQQINLMRVSLFLYG